MHRRVADIPRRSVLLAAALCALASPAPGQDAADLESLRRAYARPASVPFPPDNGWSKAREELGRALFFDPRLSASGLSSCASCHHPGLAWEDARPRAAGPGPAPAARSTPTILNLAWAPRLHWDGRWDSLEAQALFALAQAGGPGATPEAAAAKVAAIAGYRPLFEAAYPGEEIVPATLAKALATWERTLVSGRAPFDAWVEGDASAISEQALAGLLLFHGKARCASCHAGWRFTDDGFHDVGVAGDDPGRGALEEGDALLHAFKTPTLRNVTRRAPFMHDGSEPTLASVLELYDLGGRASRPGLSPLVQPLGLTEGEKAQLAAFLETLTSDDPPVTVPQLPR